MDLLLATYAPLLIPVAFFLFAGVVMIAGTLHGVFFND